MQNVIQMALKSLFFQKITKNCLRFGVSVPDPYAVMHLNFTSLHTTSYNLDIFGNLSNIWFNCLPFRKILVTCQFSPRLLLIHSTVFFLKNYSLFKKTWWPNCKRFEVGLSLIKNPGYYYNLNPDHVILVVVKTAPSPCQWLCFICLVKYAKNQSNWRDKIENFQLALQNFWRSEKFFCKWY